MQNRKIKETSMHNASKQKKKCNQKFLKTMKPDETVKKNSKKKERENQKKTVKKNIEKKENKKVKTVTYTHS